MNQTINCKSCALVFVMLILLAYAGSVYGGQSGSYYYMPKDVVSRGGGTSRSSGYILTGTAGQLSTIMNSPNGSVLYGGFWHPKAVDEHPWDFNNDQITDFIDLGLLANHWLIGCGDAGWNLKYDLNEDCIINYLDLGIFGDHWLEEN